MSESSDLIEGEFCYLYNTISKYLPDDFPPGPPFGNDRDEKRYDLIKTIEGTNIMNALIWGSNIGKFHGFLWDRVPISSNWVEFAKNYGPKLDVHFSDPKKALNALKEIYLAFGYREDGWRRDSLARKEAKLYYDQALTSLAITHKAIGNHKIKKINYGLRELTKIMFGTLLKEHNRRMKELNFIDDRREKMMKLFFNFLKERAKNLLETKEVAEVLKPSGDSGRYNFHHINKPPSWSEKN